jgi:hypothetical protein
MQHKPFVKSIFDNFHIDTKNILAIQYISKIELTKRLIRSVRPIQ